MAERNHFTGFNTSPEIRRLVELLAAKWTEKRGRRYTMTEVMEEAIRMLAKREKVEADGSA